MPNLKQHIAGKHGDGFIALCGVSFDWSDDRNEHQQRCDEHIEIKDKMHNNPVFPEKRKQQKKSIKKANTILFMHNTKTVCKCVNILCLCCRNLFTVGWTVF